MEHSSPNYSYKVKRYAVVFFSSLNILAIIIIALNAETIVPIINKHNQYPEMKPDDIHRISYAVSLVSVICIFVESTGLFGAWNENLSMTNQHGAMKVFGTILVFINALSASIFLYWAIAMWYLLTTVVAILFLRELKANSYKSRKTNALPLGVSAGCHTPTKQPNLT